MRKTIIFGSILLLTALVLMGAGCGKKEASEEPSEESLTEILSKARGTASFKYDLVITAPEQTITQKVWLKQMKMRTETIVEGQKMIYLMDMDEQIAHMYMPDQNTAMRMDFSGAQESVGESPLEQSEYLEGYNPVTLGSEIIDGKDCLVAEYSVETMGTKMWVWKEYGLPIRTESTTPEGTYLTELKNIEFTDIADSIFELPAGVQLMEIPSFGQ
jgi:outer membrane lipoprotein-sorting protein